MRQRGSETIVREDIWELGEEVGDTMRIVDKGNMEAKGGWSSRCKVDLRGTSRGRRENPLVGHVKEDPRT